MSPKRFPGPPMPENSNLLLQDLHTQQQNTHNDKMTSNNGDYLGGWSFLQALSNTTRSSENENENEKVYVHPLVKKPSSILSEKSLQMCTESLGSETGSTVSESGDELTSSSSLMEIEKSRRIPTFSMIKDRSTITSSFPPPITTIRGGSSGRVKVKSQREDGRLLIKAVGVGTAQSCFKAERKGGRLTLRFLDNSKEGDQNDLYDGFNQNLVQGDESYDVNENDEDDTSGDVGDEVEVSNLSRPSSCKEECASRSCKGMLNWETFCVATS